MPVLETYLENTPTPKELEIPFEKTPNARDIEAVVVIPVAAQQEDVQRVIDVYGQQSGNERWQLYLYLNAPDTHAAHPQIARNVESLQRAGTTLGTSGEMRWGLHFYEWEGADGEFCFGKIRKDAWLNTLHDVVGANVSENAVGFSHDADTLDISPSYIAKAVATEKNDPAHFLLSHTYWGIDGPSRPSVDSPALNRLSAYMGISEEAFGSATRIHHMWDGATGFRLGSYALAGGYKETAPPETEPLIQSIKEQSGSLKLFNQIDGEFIVSSMRRYVLRAAKGESPFSAADPRIMANDKARDMTTSHYQQAEANTRANLADWCNQADDVNISVIHDKFAEIDGEDIDVRVDFYEQVVNYGRQLLKVAGPNLNGTAQTASPVVRTIVDSVRSQAASILNDAA